MAAEPRMGAEAMAEHDERRARGALVDELADVLASVADEAGWAKIITTRAGIAVELRPAFGVPLVYWNDVVTHAANGGSLVALVDSALAVLPGNQRLLAIRQRLAASSSALTVKLRADEFASLLDRHSPWGRFCERCKSQDHLVMWVAGDSRQNVALFYERIRNELGRMVEHTHHVFGKDLGDGTVAAQWERELMRATPGYHRGMTLAQALRAAARRCPAIFLLQSHRGALADDALDEPYVAELVEFVQERFVPAAVQAEPGARPVRLFIGIETSRGQRKAKLAKALRAAMRAAMKRHRGRRIDMWEEEEIALPTWNDVKASIEELMPPGLPLDEDERDALERMYDAFAADHGGTLAQLAAQLYPLYERLYDARTRSDEDG